MQLGFIISQTILTVRSTKVAHNQTCHHSNSCCKCNRCFHCHYCHCHCQCHCHCSLGREQLGFSFNRNLVHISRMKFGHTTPIKLCFGLYVLFTVSMGQLEETFLETRTASSIQFGAVEVTSESESEETSAPAKTVTKNVTDAVENFIPDGARSIEELLGGWEAPYEIRQNYPIYLSGFDEDNRPIWIAELGKFDMRKLVEGGKQRMDSFDEYVRQLIQIMLKSIRLRSTTEEPVDRGMFIIDFDQMKIMQLAHIPTITYCLGLMKQYRHLIEDHMAKVYIVNANFVAESGLNLARPILGHMMDRFEIYGTNKARWLPQLLRAFPKDQLPEWYGGTKDHKPLLIYGRR